MNVIKKTKSKRLLSMLLILTMVLTLLPTVAFAGGSTPTVKIGGTTLESGKYYTVNTDGTLSEPADAKPTDGTGYAHWDGDNKALTLNNFDYTSPNQTDGSSSAIRIPGGDCTIRMEGASTVKAGTATASGCYSAAIYSGSTLIFEGEGELTAEGGKAGNSSYGVRSEGGVTVSGGTLTATGGEATVDSYGVRSEGGVTVSGGTLTATGGEATVDSYGVRSEGGVTVSGGTLTAKGDKAQTSFGVAAYKEGKVEVSNSGKLDAEGGEADKESYGVRTSKGNVTVSGGTLTATGGVAQLSYGVYTGKGNVTVSDDGTLTATGGEAGIGSYGVNVAGTVEVSGEGTLTAKGDKAQISYGVYVNKGKVSVSNSGTLTATGGEATGSSYGVDTGEGGVTVSGGTLTAKGGEAGVGSFGVHSKGNVTVSGGTLTAKGDKAQISYGVYTGKGNVTVSDDGTLTATGGKATGGSYGVDVAGTVEVSGGTLTATGGEATKESYGVMAQSDSIVEVKDNGALVSLGEITEGKQPTSGNYLYQEKDGNWTMNGKAPLPTGKTLTVSEGKALTVPEGAVLTVSEGAALTISEGAALDNKGTIDNEGTINALSFTRDQLGIITGSGVVNCALSFADNTAYDVPAGPDGKTYEAATAFTAADGRTPHTFTIEPAVSGLSINNENKLVYARPTANDAFTATVKVTDGANTSKTITIGIGAVTHAGGTLVPANEATCTDDGNKEYYKCSGCNKLFEEEACKNEIPDQDSVVVPALGHDYKTTWSNDEKEHWHQCSRCDDKKDTAAHDFTVQQHDETNHWNKCEACPATDTKAAHSFTVQQHDETSHWNKCAACPATDTKAAHDFTEQQRDETNHWNKCATCPATDKKVTHSFTEQQHDETNHWNKCAACPATDTKAAHSFTEQQHDETNHWNKCEACPATDTKAAHTWNYDAATEEHDKHCTVCGYVAEPQLGHTHRGTLVPEKAATCTADGNTAYYTCACGKWFSDASYNDEITNHGSVTIKALGHDYKTTWSSDEKEHLHECTRCDDKKDTAAHTWNYDTATEEHDKHCTVCGYVAQPQLGHTHKGTLVPAKYPTFTERGNKAYYTCGCGKWFEDSACKAEIADHRSVVLAMLRYEITKGMDGEYTKGSGKALTFTANGPMNRCTGIKIDGTALDESCYTLESGSTIVTLTNAYLETLSEGKHEIRVVYSGDRDEAKADFTVLKAAQALPPKTSGDSDILLWLALMLLSCGGAAAGRLCRKEEAETE